MPHLELLAQALEYIEMHITEDIHTEDIAAACFCSRSSLEKIFRFVNHISVRDYLVRRRMTKAAKTLTEAPEMSVLEVALMYGYSSNEAFARAFRQVWNILPSEYRENPCASGLFPRMRIKGEKGDDTMTLSRVFDISELYDLFQKRKDCWFVCCDIQGLIPINDISRKAGDLAILESMKRMEEVAGPEDIVFRIGGDEFIMLTDSSDESYAKALCDKILSRNGACISFEGKEIPLSLYGSVVKMGDRAKRYDELFSGLIGSIRENKPYPETSD